MIAFLTGRLALKTPTHLTLDVQVVGYEVWVPLSTYYALPSVEEATALLAGNPAFIRNATFDGVNGPNNGMQGVLTSSVNNLQPLPRLDFLDPKYPNRGVTVQSPIAFLKAASAASLFFSCWFDTPTLKSPSVASSTRLMPPGRASSTLHLWRRRRLTASKRLQDHRARDHPKQRVTGALLREW